METAAKEPKIRGAGWGRRARRVLALLPALALGTAAAAAPAAAHAKLAAPAAAAGAAGADRASGRTGGAGSAGIAASGTGGGSGGKSETAVDLVVQEVLRMLQAKVSEPVILHWLDTSGQRPAAVGSREIVELKRAGASDPLMTKLLDLAAERAAAEQPTGPPAAGARPAAPGPAAAPATAGPAAASAAPAQGSGAAAAAAPPAAGTAPVAPAPAVPAAVAAAPGHAASMHWRIAYHPNFGADDERWDLYVYLDGRYLAAIKSPVVSLLDPPVEFDRSLAPGHHVLRVVEERHLRKFGRDGWTHAAKVAPAALAFDVAPDAAGRVELRCETRPRGGPLSLRVTQGDVELARAEPAIAQPDDWPRLCEEVTAGQPAGRRPPGSARGNLGSCLHWADLWPGVTAPPSRDAVRADLERRGFRPDPARDGQ
ncbi:MAG TPA: hypothetical protein VHG32_03380 [Thermoanaerobaculia bacterium]|nr:hypothetical protein [Thermoanaerobaculia bacterium]